MAGINVLIKNLFSGHERSVRAKKNILALFAVRGYSIAVNLALVPLTLHLLDEYKYGIWITLFNVISWISIFDVGIGNGLRNKFAETIANGKLQDAREYVSTGYVVMGGISLLLILLFLAPWYFVDWSRVFNVQPELASEISWLVGIAFVLTSIQFCFKLLGTLLTASHKPAISAFIMSISNTLVLLIFIIGRKWLADSLIGIGLVYTLTPIIVFVSASFMFFAKRFYHVRPSLRFFRKDKVKSLFNLGIQFFIIQIAAVVIFSTDSMIITHTLSPKDVTSYNIVLRYFGIITVLTGIIMTPFWSAYTEASAKNDFDWIKTVIAKQIKSMIIVLMLIAILFFAAKTLIPLWLQQKIVISRSLLFGMAIYTTIAVWNNIFAFLLNGLSKPVLSSILSVFALVVNIPASIFLVKNFDIGNSGVIWGTILCLLPGVFFGPIQTFKILTKKAKGIWNR